MARRKTPAANTAQDQAPATNEAPAPAAPRARKQTTGGQIFVAKESFSTLLDGVPVSISKGVTRVREGHPLLNGREQFFEPLEVQYDIEQATADPGETR